MKILVTGATGQQGGSLARVLLKKGHQVRGLTRKPDSPAAKAIESEGAEVMQGSLNDGSSLKRAAAGCGVVFSMTTPFEAGMAAETAQGKLTADAAKAAGAHLIYTSVVAADKSTGIPHFDSKFEVEKHIREIGVPFTIVAPAYFMENATSPFVPPVAGTGALAVPLSPDRKLQQIALADLGAFVALVAEQRDRFAGRRIDLASDELTGAEAAAILSRVIGKPIAYRQVPIETVRAALGEDLAIMFEWFERVGYNVDLPALRRDNPEVRWHTYEEWARERTWTDAASPQTE